MVQISAFADEISPDLDVQFDTLEANGVGSIEFRKAGGKRVLEHTEREIAEVARRASARGVSFTAIGSPLGKFPLTDDFSLQIEGVKKALDYAAILEAPYVRIFSFYLPEGSSPTEHRSQVMDQLWRLVEEAEKTNIVLAHENEKGIYGDTGERCLDIYETIQSDSFGGIFDFSNYVQGGESPYSDCWPRVRRFIRYFHIKDALRESRKVVPAGRGDGDVEKILTEALAENPEYILSLEPHLSEEYGASGPERFAIAVEALKNVLGAIYPADPPDCEDSPHADGGD